MAIAAHALTAEQYFELAPELPRFSQLIEGEVAIVDTPSALMLRRSGPEARDFDVELALHADGRLCSPQLPGFGVRVRDLFP